MLRMPITSRRRNIVLLWGLARNARKRLMCEAIAAGPGFFASASRSILL